MEGGTDVAFAGEAEAVLGAASATDASRVGSLC